jgi:hypothetical protein
MNWDFIGFLATAVSIGVALTIPFGIVTLYRAVGRRIERNAAGSARELAELRERLSQVEASLLTLRDSDVRLQDVEERLDFAERVMGNAGTGMPELPELPGAS